MTIDYNGPMFFNPQKISDISCDEEKVNNEPIAAYVDTFRTNYHNQLDDEFMDSLIKTIEVDYDIQLPSSIGYSTTADWSACAASNVVPPQWTETNIALTLEELKRQVDALTEKVDGLRANQPIEYSFKMVKSNQRPVDDVDATKLKWDQAMEIVERG